MYTSLMLLLLVAVGVVAADSSLCKFPALAQHGANDTWRRVSRDPLYSQHHQRSRWELTGSVIKVEHGLSNYQYSDVGGYQLVCVQNVTPEKSLVKRVEDGHQASFACIRFIRRSEIVLQVEFSRFISSPDTALCTDSSMVGNGTTLVQFQSTSDAWSSILSRIPYTKCPYSDGYIVTSWQDDLGTRHEDTNSGMRIEAECGKGSGIILTGSTHDFPSPLEGILFDGDSLMCLATWSSGQYQFSVVVDDVPYSFMCLRTPKDPQAQFTVDYFIDGICDDSSDYKYSKAYANVNVQKYVVNDLCSDRFPSCAQPVEEATCSLDKSSRCPNTCRACQGPFPWSGAKLPSDLHGKWHRETLLLGEGEMTITDTGISFTHLGEWTFVGPSNCNRRRYGMQSNGTEYMLMSSSRNGCLPRVATIMIIRFSPAVLGVQLSQSAVADLDIDEETGRWNKDMSSWCKQTYYGEHVENLRDRYHVGSFAWYNFIKEDPNIPLSQCNMNLYSRFLVEFNTGRRCSATIQQGSSRDTFDMTIEWCNTKRPSIPGGLKTPVKHECLADFKGKSWSTYVVTRTPDGVNVANRKYVCWWLSDDEPLGYLMRVGDCHEETNAEIKAGTKSPLATLRFIDPGPPPEPEPGSEEEEEVEVVVGEGDSSQDRVRPGSVLLTLGFLLGFLHTSPVGSLW